MKIDFLVAFWHDSSPAGVAAYSVVIQAPDHANMPLLCYACHTVHPTASVETRFLREQTVKPLCQECHREAEQ